MPINLIIIMDNKIDYSGLEIAIVGISCRMPGAKNHNEFWDNIKEGKECVKFFTDAELEDVGIDKKVINNPNYVKANTLMEDKECFDSSFFGYSPIEAKVMSPQMRIMHECAWNALEDAAINPDDKKQLIGLYAGVSGSFEWEATTLLSEENKILGNFYSGLLNNGQLVSQRLSNQLDLRGPSISITSACSTSLVAVHLASRALITGECNVALAGGATILMQKNGGYLYQDDMIFSPDGHCRTFDENAKGTIFGDGVGIVVLKRLKDAIKDNDNIYAIIKGSAINNDGKNKVAFSAPSVQGQALVIKKAMKVARILPETISYVEAHGTGTSIGDPIEVEALKKAFNSNKLNYCGIGSVKSNIGHVEMAAGIASLIKVALSIKNKEIPPTINFERPNSKIDFENSPFFVNTKLKKWENEEFPLRAGVSSFGIGGTNAHVIMEEAPKQQISSNQKHNNIFTFSAKTENALNSYITTFRDYLKKDQKINLLNVAFTLNKGRKHFQYRKMVVASSINPLLEVLSQPNEIPLSLANKNRRSIVFMFPGQGSQYINMGRNLYLSERLFKSEMDKCFQIIKNKFKVNLYDILFPENDIDSNINNTKNTQPLLFIFEYALSKLINSWGIEPTAMIGHSIGECVAACISGVISLEDALTMIYYRGKLMSELPEGKMLGVNISETNILPYLTDAISIAAINSPNQIVLSGDNKSIEDIKVRLEEKNIHSKFLHTSHAFHSCMMNGMMAEFEKHLSEITFNKPEVSFISNLTGVFVNNDEVNNSDYWLKHIRQTVNFKHGIETLLKNDDESVFIEVGPGNTLISLVNQIKKESSDCVSLSLVKHPKKNIDDETFLANNIGKLWQLGIDINWEKYYDDFVSSKLSLPVYQFEKKKYDFNSLNQTLSNLSNNNESIRNDNIDSWAYAPTWKQSIKEFNTNTNFENETWLVFKSNNPISRELLNLNTGAVQYIEIEAGNKFEKISSTNYIVKPDNQEDYYNLFLNLKNDEINPKKIVHLWTISNENTKVLNTEKIANFAKLGLLSLTNIAKSIDEIGITDMVEIDVITNNIFEVIGNELLYPEKTTMLGAIDLIPQEYGNINCRCIDIDLNENNTIDFKLVFKELNSNIEEPVCAIRGKYKWVKEFTNINFQETARSENNFIVDKKYVVIGGLSGIALELLCHISKKEKVEFILLDKLPFPTVDNWDKHLIDNPNNYFINDKIKKLNTIIKNGCSLSIKKLDVNNFAEINTFLDLIDQDNIKGILFMAGGLDQGGIIQNRSSKNLLEQNQTTLNGVVNTLNGFDISSLDFIYLFSSLGTIVPRLKTGQIGHVATNHFLDSLAHYQKHNSELKIKVVNWPDWIEAGMIMDYLMIKHDTNKEKIIKETDTFGDNCITNQEGVNIFDRILYSNNPQLIISKYSISELNKKPKRNNTNQEIETINKDAESAKEQNIDIVKYQIESIFKQIFTLDKINGNDDFFELGGNSLIAISAINLIFKSLKVKIPLSEFFKNSTINDLLKYINSLNKIDFYNIKNTERKEYYRLSSAQKRMFVLQNLYPKSTSYNQTRLAKVVGNLDRNKFLDSCRKLIQRHEILRTSFKIINGTPYQYVNKNIEFNIEYYEESENNVNKILNTFKKPFDLASPTLFRVCLIKIDENSYVLIIDMHHIITDEVSNDVIIEDLRSIYDKDKLPSLKLQYIDYSEWQNNKQYKDRIKKQEEYWLNLYKGKVPELNLPSDFVRPQIKNFSGDNIIYELNKDISLQLIDYAKNNNITQYMLLLSIFNIFLSKLTGKEDIVIGSSTLGRNHIDLQNIPGMFVNMLSMRNYPSSEMKFNEFLLEVKENALMAYENQDYPYDELTLKLGLHGKPNRNPLFDVIFEIHQLEANKTPKIKQENEFKIEPFSVSDEIKSIVDLLLTVTISENRIYLNMRYSKELFNRNTINIMLTYYERIAEQVIKKPGILLKDIVFTSPKQKNVKNLKEIETGEFNFG